MNLENMFNYLIISLIVLTLVTASATIFIMLKTRQPELEKTIQPYNFSIMQNETGFFLRNIGNITIPKQSVAVYIKNSLMNISNIKDIIPNATYFLPINELVKEDDLIRVVTGSTYAEVIFKEKGAGPEQQKMTPEIPSSTPSQPSAPPIQQVTNNYTLSFIISPMNSATVNLSTGNHTYLEGTRVVINITPALGYLLDYWLLNGQNQGNSTTISITMNQNHTLQAVLSLIQKCERSAPLITLTKLEPLSYAGMVYRISVKNNDATGCQQTLFTSTHNCTGSLTCSFSETSFSLLPSESKNFNISINTTSVVSGNYSINVSISSVQSSLHNISYILNYSINQNLVKPIIFFTTNYTVDNQLVKFFEDKIFEIRKFYFNNNNNKTFQSLPLTIVTGDHDTAWYWCKLGQTGCAVDNFEANLVEELIAKGHMAGAWERSDPNRIIWVMVMGGGGYAGARIYPTTGGGLAIVGDAGIYASIDNNCNRISNWYGHPDEPNNIKTVCMNTWIPSGKQYGFGVGALGHELGHAFDLPHPDAYGYNGGSVQWSQTIMGEHWNYPNTGLLNEDRNKLAISKFFLN